MYFSSALIAFIGMSLPFLASAAPGQAAPHSLKQATRSSILARANRPLRRAGASCTACSDCCPAFSMCPGSTPHAVYENTQLPTSNYADFLQESTQGDLESCIRTCCAVGPCNTAQYTAASGNCKLYSAYRNNAGGYLTQQGVTLVKNKVTCQDNAASSGTRTCCNAPIVLP